ncbi:hypothetical protein C8Q76DRAFT_601086, partial [Earliella scabrosa]
LPNLLKLRLCSKALYNFVAAELFRSLQDLLALYVPDPIALGQMLIGLRGYVSGEAALRFLVRDAIHHSAFAATLDLYLPYESYARAMHHLLFVQKGTYDPGFPHGPNGTRTLPQRFMTHHYLADISTVSTSQGVVRVFRSTTSEALAPISCAWSSLHVIYVTPRVFGAAYPSLLFAHRGVLGDGHPQERQLVAMHARAGFDLRLDVSLWAE